MVPSEGSEIKKAYLGELIERGIPAMIKKPSESFGPHYTRWLHDTTRKAIPRWDSDLWKQVKGATSAENALVLLIKENPQLEAYFLAYTRSVVETGVVDKWNKLKKQGSAPTSPFIVEMGIKEDLCAALVIVNDDRTWREAQHGVIVPKADWLQGTVTGSVEASVAGVTKKGMEATELKVHEVEDEW